MSKEQGVCLRVVSGQKAADLVEVPPDVTIREIIEDSIAEMPLPKNDSRGERLNYVARLEREGRQLNFSETVSDALQEGDTLTLRPDNIDAG